MAGSGRCPGPAGFPQGRPVIDGPAFGVVPARPVVSPDGAGLGPGIDRDGDGTGPGTTVRPGVAVALGAGLTRWITGAAGAGGLAGLVPVSTPPASTPPTTAAAAATAAEQLRAIRLRRRRSPSRMTSVAAVGWTAAAA
jgi:hypothetical protein